ncbi:MAG: hypothetical protein E6R03_09280 [Hyphomicrobiaceae bacterium]|nr:MAG: hypothetical protein E6R03_09280 [Hyphomicrobiaceae bacterium]
MITALAIFLTLNITITAILALVVGNVINRCKKHEALLVDLSRAMVNVAIVNQKVSENQEKLANEVADAMPHFVRKGEVN